MNNNAAALLRALITYVICAPLAVIIGYLLVQAANIPTRATFTTFGLVLLAVSAPIWLRWHYPLMLLCWNLPVVLFFVRGSPPVFLPAMGLSLILSIAQRTMSREMRFLHAPQIALPLLVLSGVALVTAKLTGGFGLHALGSEVMGGKKYVFLLAGVAGYFALTARRIPPEKAGLYLALFFLPCCVGIIGDMVGLLPPALNYLFLLIPPNFYVFQDPSVPRLAATSSAAFLVFSLMLVRYGIRGCFLSGKWWRAGVLALAFVGIFLGGFRGTVLYGVLLFAIQFFMEGLHRTRLLPLFLFLALVAGVLCVPLADKLPRPVQRALSFLPLHVDPVARMEAQASLDWHINLWESLLPEVPRHLWLGKGYAITESEYAIMAGGQAYHVIDPSQQGLALASDYHNGPLSVILPFGIWGVIAFLWFIIAGWWALHRNFRYGDPALQTINTGLYVLFMAKTIYFFAIYGALSSDVATFGAFLGLSIALNGGICRRPVMASALQPVKPAVSSMARPSLQPAFQP